MFYDTGLVWPGDPSAARRSTGRGERWPLVTDIVAHQHCSPLLPAAKGKKIKSIESPRRGKCCQSTSGESALLWIQCPGGATELPCSGLGNDPERPFGVTAGAPRALCAPARLRQGGGMPPPSAPGSGRAQVRRAGPAGGAPQPLSHGARSRGARRGAARPPVLPRGSVSAGPGRARGVRGGEGWRGAEC